MTPDTPTNPPEASRLADAVFNAAWACPHAIDSDEVRLQFDAKQPGHNALNQLHRRISAALAQQAAPVEAVRVAPEALVEEYRSALICQERDDGMATRERVGKAEAALIAALASQPPAAAEPVAVEAPMPELTDAELIELGRHPVSRTLPWGIGWSRAEYLRVVRAVLADRAARVAKEGAK